MKRCCYELEFLDIDYKWLDNTKTTVQLVYYNELGVRNVLGYVHDDIEVEVAKTNPNFYFDIIIDVIRDSALKRINNL